MKNQNENQNVLDVLEQLPGEDSQAFSAFAAYARLGMRRSLAGTAKAVGKGVGTVRRWATEFDWENRVEEYDLQMVAVKQGRYEADLKARAVDWAARQAELREIEWSTTHEALLRVKALLQRPKLSTEKAVKALEVLSLIARRSAELPVKEATEASTEVIAPVQVNIREALRRVYGEDYKRKTLEGGANGSDQFSNPNGQGTR
jgi:hypothetical protein